MCTGGLTSLQRDVLRCEMELQNLRQGRSRVIRDRLGLSDVRYEQILRSLVGVPAAVAFAPDVMHRVERRLHRQEPRDPRAQK